MLTETVLTEAMEWERRSDMYLQWAADAEARGDREIARVHFIYAEAHDVQTRLWLGLPTNPPAR